MGYKDVLTMWDNKDLGEMFIDDNDWETVIILLEFLEVFYLVTAVFSNIYTTSSHIALHKILKVTICFVNTGCMYNKDLLYIK